MALMCSTRKERAQPSVIRLYLPPEAGKQKHMSGQESSAVPACYVVTL